MHRLEKVMLDIKLIVTEWQHVTITDIQAINEVKFILREYEKEVNEQERKLIK